MTSKGDTQSDNNREETLMKLLSGQLDPEQGEGKALLEQDPELKREFNEIRALTHELDEFGLAETDAVSSLPTELPPSPVVDETLKKLWDEEDRAATAPSLPEKSISNKRNFFPISLLAAACLLLLVAGWYILRDKEDKPMEYLGETFAVTSAQGEVDEYPFSWQAFLLPPGGFFMLLIDQGNGPEEVWRGTDTQWQPSPQQRAAMPDRIEWWVEAFGPNEFDPIARSNTVTLVRK